MFKEEKIQQTFSISKTNMDWVRAQSEKHSTATLNVSLSDVVNWALTKARESQS